MFSQIAEFYTPKKAVTKRLNKVYCHFYRFKSASPVLCTFVMDQRLRLMRLSTNWKSVVPYTN